MHGESSGSAWRPRRGVPGTPVPVGKCRRAQLPRGHPGSAETDLRLARGESGVSKHATHTSGSGTGHCGLIKEGTRPVFCNPEHAAGSTWGLCPAEETPPRDASSTGRPGDTQNHNQLQASSGRHGVLTGWPKRKEPSGVDSCGGFPGLNPASGSQQEAHAPRALRVGAAGWRPGSHGIAAPHEDRAPC